MKHFLSLLGSLPLALAACSPVNALPRADGERFRRCQAYMLAASCRESESGGDCARRLAAGYSEAPEEERAAWAASAGCPEGIAGGSSTYRETPPPPAPEAEVIGGSNTRGERTLTLIVRAGFATLTLTGTPVTSRDFLSMRVQWNPATPAGRALGPCSLVGLVGAVQREGRAEQSATSRLVSVAVEREEVQRALGGPAPGVTVCGESVAFRPLQRARARDFLERWAAAQ